jgi:hypothetical protein
MAGLGTGHLVGALQLAGSGADAHLSEMVEVVPAVNPKTAPVAPCSGDRAAGFEQLQIARRDSQSFASLAYVNLLNRCGVHM